MDYRIAYMPQAMEHLRELPAYAQRLILDTIDEQLLFQPEAPTRNRKKLQPNELAAWELRIGDYRVFYEVEASVEPDQPVVSILAIGEKRGGRLWIANEEYEL